MTGADDSTDQSRLIEISKEYPFVEWGILVSRNSQGSSRFPSEQWRNNFAEVLMESPKINLSCHVCGTYVKELLMGSGRFIGEIGKLWGFFDRMQINTHGIKHQFEFAAIAGLKELHKEIIFQYDAANTAIMDWAYINHVRCSALFDMSHGAGVLPEEWLKPLEAVKCGYAGGLSPDNITEQLALIESKVGDYELWIDMETKVRSNNDQLFDLDKVVAVLETCKQSGLILTKQLKK